MSNLSYQNAAELVAACRTGAEEAAKAFGRALGGSFQLDASADPMPYASGTLPDSFDGPGLAILLQWGEAGLVALLPESSGLLPAWYGQPGATEQNRLDTLAQELSLTLLPETLETTSTRTAKVDSLSEAVERGQPANVAGQLELTLGGDHGSGPLRMIWPLTRAAATLVEQEAAADAKQVDDNQPGDRPSSDRSENVPQSSNSIPDPAASAAKVEASNQTSNLIEQLPPYTRSLLKIRVPMSVRLASKRQTIRQILQLGPGAIISFDKPCDEMLELCAGECTVATGEAVKVGDKFGLRIHAMTKPEERFRKVARRA